MGYLNVSLDALDPSKLDVDPPGIVPKQGWYLGPDAAANQSSLGPGAVVLADAEVTAGAKLEDCVVWSGPSDLRMRKFEAAFGPRTSYWSPPHERCDVRDSEQVEMYWAL